jgi:hypothetical protein
MQDKQKQAEMWRQLQLQGKGLALVSGPEFQTPEGDLDIEKATEHLVSLTGNEGLDKDVARGLIAKDYIAQKNTKVAQGQKDKELQVKQDKVEKKRPIYAGQLKELADIEANISEIEGFVSRVKETGVDSGLQNELVQRSKSLVGASEDVTRSELLRIVSNYIANISGKTVTEPERIRLEQFLPTWKQNPKLLMAQVAGLLNERVVKYNAILNTLEKADAFNMGKFEQRSKVDDSAGVSGLQGPTGNEAEFADMAESGIDAAADGAGGLSAALKYIIDKVTSSDKSSAKAKPKAPVKPISESEEQRLAREKLKEFE